MSKKVIQLSVLIMLCLGSLHMAGTQLVSQAAAAPGCDVAGAIIADTAWSPASCATYNVTGNVIVNDGATLTIQPGTTMRFAANTGIIVQGGLEAVGTASKPILFTSANGSPAAGDWSGISFGTDSVSANVDAAYNYLSGSIIQFSTIEYATKAIDIEYAAPYIAHNTILNNKQGIEYFAWTYVSYPLLIIRDNIITNNGNDETVTRGAAIYLYRGLAHIMDNLISHNSTYSNGGGIYLYSSYGAEEGFVVSGNTIIYNTTTTTYGGGGGIYVGGGDVTLTNNVITNNQNLGSQSQGGGVWFSQSKPNFIQGNFVASNESGFGGGLYYDLVSMMGISTDNVIENNTAVNEGGGVYFSPLSAAEKFTFRHNSLHNNMANGSANDASVATNYSGWDDINATENWWGSTNPATIESHVFHAVDNANRALILFQPILTKSPSSEGAVQTSGGTFSTADGIVQLDVPTNAIAEPVTIHYSRLFTPTTTLSNNKVFALGFNLRALKADGTAVTQFAKPLTLTITYPSDTELASMGINEDQLTLMYWDGTQWQAAYPCSGCSLNTAQNKMTVIIDHFTEFALVNEKYRLFLPTIIR